MKLFWILMSKIITIDKYTYQKLEAQQKVQTNKEILDKKQTT